MSERKINLPTGSAGLIIGRGGATIRTLMADTGTSIGIDRNSNTATIRGAPYQIDVAVQAINRLVGSDASPHQERRELHLPPGSAGVIIGKKGANIQQLQQETRAYISVQANNEDRSGTVKIAGTRGEVEAAVARINELLRRMEVRNEQGHRTVTATYEVPRSVITIIRCTGDRNIARFGFTEDPPGSRRSRIQQETDIGSPEDTADTIAERLAHVKIERDCSSKARTLFVTDANSRGEEDTIRDYFMNAVVEAASAVSSSMNCVTSNDPLAGKPQAKVCINIGSQFYYADDKGRFGFPNQPTFAGSLSVSDVHDIEVGPHKDIRTRFITDVDKERIEILRQRVLDLGFQTMSPRESFSCHLNVNNTKVVVRFQRVGGSDRLEIKRIKAGNLRLCFVSITRPLPAPAGTDFRLKLHRRPEVPAEDLVKVRPICAGAVYNGKTIILTNPDAIVDTVRHKEKTKYIGEFEDHWMQVSIDVVNDEEGEHREVVVTNITWEEDLSRQNHDGYDKLVRLCDRLTNPMG